MGACCSAEGDDEERRGKLVDEKSALLMAGKQTPPTTVGAPHTRRDAVAHSYSFVSPTGSRRRRIASYIVGERDQRPLLSIATTAWQKPLHDSPSTYRDLPRLARQIRVHAREFQPNSNAEVLAAQFTSESAQSRGEGSIDAMEHASGESARSSASASASGTAQRVVELEVDETAMEGSRAQLSAELAELRRRQQVAAEITNSPASKLLRGSARSSVPAVLLRRFLKISALLGASDEELDQIRTVFARNFRDPNVYARNAALSSPGANPMQRCLLELFPIDRPEPPLAKVLKCCNQSCLAPAVLRLKTHLSELIYRDVRGGWHVRITISPAFVEVLHLKTEQNVKLAENPELGEFRFIWQYRLQFSPDMRKLQQAGLKVISAEFGEHTAPAVRRRVQQELKPLLGRG
mmetsp:Transcript_1451/g.3423  ORF Transcript_1451/g.3423 Transcript_1451/m.3423 type:complete len:407 (+) Transcript_1451:92-1312(+)|eukprot:CAMPEP_0177678114 /NCGR_PEP_ID=MMETSP0447-20121125/28825_1 /TAXON_ID=0 /ORGANISM="Stygamoeba regulata, Strain BSH-02190019" /LENGTH=406 /DNA_ID=CAMNT_0019187073 /DNA_START=40 /DNA_END=1260 /DNA_ORIENTATION=+